MNKHSATLTDGTVVTRNSKNRVYEYVVAAYWTAAKKRANVRAHLAHHEEKLAEYTAPGYAEKIRREWTAKFGAETGNDAADNSVPKWIESARKGVATCEAELAGIDDDYREPAGISWAGRWDLADKRAAEYVSRFGHAEVVPAEIA